jgi:hypothetical protein
MGYSAEIKALKKFRVRSEAKIKILNLVNGFKSEEEPEYKGLTKEDKINIYSSLIKKLSE